MDRETSAPPLWRRGAPAAAGSLRIDGVGVTLTAWAATDDGPLMLEFADHPAALRFAAERLGEEGAEMELRGGDGERRTWTHAVPELASWSQAKPGPDGVATGFWLGAPAGRMVLDAEQSPDPRRHRNLLDAARPVSMVLDAAGSSFLMLTGLQQASAAEDEQTLAAVFAGLLRDCLYLPLPDSEALELRLWRDLRRAPDFVAGDGRPAVVGAVDMEGNAQALPEEIDGRDMVRPIAPVVTADAGGGVRCWLVSHRTREASENALAALVRDGEWRTLVSAGDLAGGMDQ